MLKVGKSADRQTYANKLLVDVSGGAFNPHTLELHRRFTNIYDCFLSVRKEFGIGSENPVFDFETGAQIVMDDNSKEGAALLAADIARLEEEIVKNETKMAFKRSQLKELEASKDYLKCHAKEEEIRALDDVISGDRDEVEKMKATRDHIEKAEASRQYAPGANPNKAYGNNPLGNGEMPEWATRLFDGQQELAASLNDTAAQVRFLAEVMMKVNGIDAQVPPTKRPSQWTTSTANSEAGAQKVPKTNAPQNNGRAILELPVVDGESPSRASTTTEAPQKVPHFPEDEAGKASGSDAGSEKEDESDNDETCKEKP